MQANRGKGILEKTGYNLAEEKLLALLLNIYKWNGIRMFWRGTMTNMLLITDEADNHTNQDVPTYQP